MSIPKSKVNARSPGYPSYGPDAVTWLNALNKDPYFAAPEGPAMKAAEQNAQAAGYKVVTK